MGVKWPFKSLSLYVPKSHECFAYVTLVFRSKRFAEMRGVFICARAATGGVEWKRLKVSVLCVFA